MFHQQRPRGRIRTRFEWGENRNSCQDKVGADEQRDMRAKGIETSACLLIARSLPGRSHTSVRHVHNVTQVLLIASSGRWRSAVADIALQHVLVTGSDAEEGFGTKAETNIVVFRIVYRPPVPPAAYPVLRTSRRDDDGTSGTQQPWQQQSYRSHRMCPLQTCRSRGTMFASTFKLLKAPGI